jgi:purine-nucleoside phosphorylase
MGKLHEQVIGAANSVKERIKGRPVAGIILGTGLSHLGNAIEDAVYLDYGTIPGFPLSTVETHAGRLIYGRLAKKQVIAMQGRFHRYEGYEGEHITFGVRVMKELGIESLIVSNACGGLLHTFEPSDVVQITDHINLLGFNPLRGENEEQWGPRFPSMHNAYSAELAALAHQVALEKGISLKTGVYAPVIGPNLETRAEYRMIRAMGADLVGMSTVPEVIAAQHMGLPVLAFSVVTDMCLPDNLSEATFAEIVAMANKGEPKLTAIVEGVLDKL